MSQISALVMSLLGVSLIAVGNCADPCDSSPCINGGMCDSTCPSYSCDCPPLYTGSNCEIIRRCITENIVCDNGGTCADDADGPFCLCAPSWIGDNCTESCDVTIDLTSQSSATLTSPYYPDFYPNGTHCTYKVFTVPNKQVQLTFTQFDVTSVTVGQCYPDYYSDMYYFPCDHSHPHEDCPHLYTFEVLQGWCPCVYDRLFVLDVNSTRLSDEIGVYCNERLPPNIISENNELKLVFNSDLKCSRPSAGGGFHIIVSAVGDQCSPNPCENNGACTDLIDDFLCSCPPVYTGRTCTLDVNECLNSSIEICTSDPNKLGYCVNDIGSYHCECRNSSRGIYWNGQNCTTGKEPDNLCSVDNGLCTDICSAFIYMSDISNILNFGCGCNAGYYLLKDGRTCRDIDECDTNCLSPDGPAAECLNTLGSYMCTCPTGFQWNSTYCDDIDECAINNGRCDQICTNLNGTYNCSCNTGYNLAINGLTCIKETGFCSDPTLCEHQCVQNGASHTCICPQGYAVNGTNCTDINECDNGSNGGCPHTCTNIPGSFNCGCHTGYYLLNDRVDCQDINECSTGVSNCSDDCLNTIGSFECTCPDGFVYNITSQTCDDINECDTNNGRCSQICTNVNGTYSCSCNPGYNLAINGWNCIKETGFCSDTTLCEYQCVQNGVSYKCLCPPGYLVNGTNCTDINECTDGTNGGCPQTCTNIPGSYNCDCMPGYFLLIDKKTCTDINECTTGISNCTHGCLNTVGSFQCTCPRGFVYNTTSKTCDDVNECSVKNGACPHVCTNTPGSYNCGCSLGYYLLIDQNTCADINECSTGTSNCSHGCINTIGSFRCTCPNGFVYNTSTNTCDDVDECSINNGKCEQNCVNTNSSYYCSCKSGFSLSLDQRSCLDINECQLNSTLCSYQCRNSYGSYYCICPAGYTLIYGVLCKAPISISITVPLNMQYEPSMANPGSSGFRNLASSLESSLDTDLNSIDFTVAVPKHTRVSVMNLRNGSVIALVDLAYNTALTTIETSVITSELANKIQSNGQVITIGNQSVPVIGNLLLENDGNGANASWDIVTVCHVYNNLRICQNGAICKEVNSIPTCVCADGYTGNLCTESETLNPTSIITIATLLPLGLIFAFVVILIVCIKRRKLKEVHTLVVEREPQLVSEITAEDITKRKLRHMDRRERYSRPLQI